MKASCGFAVCAALILTVAPAAQAQNASLTNGLKLSAKVIVTERTGAEREGRVLRASPSELVLMVDGKEQVIPSIDIGRIEKRDSLWNGMVLGGVPFAMLVGAGAGSSCSPDCGRVVSSSMLIGGAIGAGVGALIDASIHGHSILDGPPLGSPNARRTPQPVTTLDDLWLRVRTGDSIDVVTHRGQKVAGRFVQVSNGLVTLTVKGTRQDIPASTVRLVTRSGNRYRSGALFGGAIGAAVGVAAFASCNDACGSPIFAPFLLGSSGALWGTIIGAAIPKHPVVFGANLSSTTRVMPVLGPGRAGVSFSKTF